LIRHAAAAAVVRTAKMVVYTNIERQRKKYTMSTDESDSSENWLAKNLKALAAVKRGLADAEAGRLNIINLDNVKIAVLTTHSSDKCAGEYCCVHNPSEHHMRDWPMHWRDDKKQMERICPHGVGHPDPDDAAYNARIGCSHKNIHGCDGCCRKPD
jgi:predicted transcriptional regulator